MPKFIYGAIVCRSFGQAINRGLHLFDRCSITLAAWAALLTSRPVVLIFLHHSFNMAGSMMHDIMTYMGAQFNPPRCYQKSSVDILSQLALRCITKDRRDNCNERNAFLLRPRCSLNHTLRSIVAKASPHLALALVGVGALKELANESS